MYCLKCGRPVDGATLCAQCAAEEHAKQQQYYYARTLYPEPDNRMYGFGKALTSTILSNIGFFFVYFAMALAGVSESAEVALFLFLISLPLVIIPFVLGISSINTFRKRKAPCVRPVATLVLGIVGLATSAFALLFDFIILMAIGMFI